MGRGAGRSVGLIQRGHLQEEYKTLCGKLAAYRLDTDLASARQSVLSFVTGLRFSALLIYRIRSILQGTNLEANWGVIVDDDETGCSAECDIIIHDERGSLFSWNDGDDVGGRVMDFHFVRKDKAKLVISCKAQCLAQIDEGIRNDATNLQDYVGRIWLFAECCQDTRVKTLRERAARAGYEKFFYLYLLPAERGECKYDERVWLRFAEALTNLSSV